MVKPLFPGSSSALLPRQEEGSRGSVGKPGSAALCIPALIPPAPLARLWGCSAGGAHLHQERDWGASWALSSPQDREWGPSAAPPPLQIPAVSRVLSRLGIPFLVASLGSWGGVLGTPCLPSAQGLGSGNGVLKPVGLMPLGGAFARALLDLWLEQHCWSQLWVSTAALRSSLGRGEAGAGTKPRCEG